MSRRYHFCILFFILCCLILLGLALLSSVSAETIYVDADNNEGPWQGSEEFPFLSLQDAINDANESDTIMVYSGTYNENIVINKSVSIIGSDAQTTHISGVKNNENAVQITASNVNISGFKINNEAGMDNRYHALFIGGVSNCSIINNIIEKGENGIYLITANNNDIMMNNLRNNNQRGLIISNSNLNFISQNTIENNGDGIRITNSEYNEIFDNVITNNNIGLNIASNANNNIVYKNDFDNNYASNAYDAGSNTWAKNGEGNYWDDYDDYDSDNDGIGNSAYQIDGGSNADGFPLGDFLTPDPVAYIDSISPNPAIGGESIDFYGHGTPSENIADWQWRSSKDGIIHEGSADFSSSSLSLGTHTIRFRVKDGSGLWSEYDTETLVINDESSWDNDVPSATIVTISPMEAKAGESVYFHGYGTDDDGSIVAYNWRSSKDDVISTESSFTISTLSVGTHEIRFKVKDDSGDWSSTKTETLVILQNVSLNSNPVAECNGPFTGMINAPVLFDASSSYDPDDDVIETYQWDFGDGRSGSGKIISHSYNRSGNFTVTLTVTDERGAHSSISSFVLIFNQSSNQDTNQDTSDSDNTSNGEFPSVPGFEFILLMSAFFVFLYIRKR